MAFMISIERAKHVPPQLSPGESLGEPKPVNS
jgi:hypothetical protein